MNINSLPKQVFGYLCAFLDAKSRSNLNITCKKFSEWEKNFPFWELVQDVQLTTVELLKPIHFSRKFSEINVSLCEFQKNPSISSCVKLYQNRNDIVIMNKAFEMININPIDLGCLLEKTKDLIAKNNKDINCGKLKIEESKIKDFFVLYAEVHISEFCNRKTKALVGPQIKALRKTQQIILIYKEHYSHSYTENCEIFIKELNAMGREYKLSMKFLPN